MSKVCVPGGQVPLRTLFESLNCGYSQPTMPLPMSECAHSGQIDAPTLRASDYMTRVWQGIGPARRHRLVLRRRQVTHRSMQLEEFVASGLPSRGARRISSALVPAPSARQEWKNWLAMVGPR